MAELGKGIGARLLKLKEKLDVEKQQKAQLQGQLNTHLQQLHDDFDIENVEDAQDALDTMETELKDQQATLEIAVEKAEGMFTQ